MNREHICDLCGVYLGEIPKSFYFSHILSKGAYPAYKLNPENLMLNCFDCHQKWDHGDPTALKGYKNISNKKQELKSNYYEK